MIFSNKISCLCLFSSISFIKFFQCFTNFVLLCLYYQNAEISELRSSTLETSGWLEEARSREGAAEQGCVIVFGAWDPKFPKFLAWKYA